MSKEDFYGDKMEDLESTRLSILEHGLNLEDFKTNPIEQFTLWLQQASDTGIHYPTAMSLATVTKDGKPMQRFVILRNFDAKGFIFFTSLSSRKAEQIAGNPNVSLIFPWHMLERQVQISGHAEKLSKVEMLKYFASGSKGSQLSAWLSEQPSPVSNRGMLESKLKEIKERFSKGEVSMPSFWGGYRIVPDSYEYWQSGEDKVNDRFVYERDGENWVLGRMAP